ncbi:MAG: hypothetical protein SF051_08225, partial [Elusimicrobiota bacterium]|nr:hypothetical protein [Elusimicrobiota bacterium]
MRRVLALALLLCCVPAAGTDAPDPAFDRDGDGTVTRKEERQGRRAVRRENRRARRGLDGELEDDGGSTTEEDAARQQAAAGTAASLARSMNALLPSADAGALPSGGAAASAGARGPSAAAKTGAAAP